MLEQFREIADTIFLSTLSLRRATNLTQGVFNLFTFLSTLSLRRATINRSQMPHIRQDISIHALLTESDWHSERQIQRG